MLNSMSLVSRVTWWIIIGVFAVSCNRAATLFRGPKVEPAIDYCARGMALRAGLEDNAGEGAGEAFLRMGLIQNPSHHACRFAYGRALTSVGLVNEARRELKKVITEADSESIRKEAKRFLDIRLPPLDIPEEAVMLNGTGWNALFRKNDVDLAISLFERAIAQEPQFTWPWNNLAVAYYRKKEYSKAIEMARRAIEIAPLYRNAYRTLGRIFTETGQMDEALAMREKVLILDPHDPHAKRMVAWLLMEKPANLQGDWQRARNLLEEASTADPDDRWTNMKIAMIDAQFHLDKGEYTQAEQSAKQALALSPEDLRSWGILGQAYEGQNRFEEALQAYDQALHFFPEYGLIRNKRETLWRHMNLK